MKRFTRAGVLAAVLLSTLAVASSPVRPFGFSGLSLGVSVVTLIQAHGSPDVVTTDVGQIWTWTSPGGKVRVTTGDDGIVHLFDVLPAAEKPVSFSIPGSPPLALTFGLTTLPEAELRYKPIAAFAARADFPDSGTTADVRAFDPARGTQAVLLFDDASKILREAFYGEPPYLARAGVEPAATTTPPAKYTAPVLVHQGASDYPPTKRQGDAFVRISVDAAGHVSGATIFSSAGDVNLDRAAIASAQSYVFEAATRNGVPVPSVFFHKETFRTLPPKT